MNLRHKKPINSYKGQANCDKNEFNDDDFKHQPSPMKKFNNVSGQQIYKYSRILTKFINKSNQYYRQKLKSGKCSRTQPGEQGQQAKIDNKQMSLIQYLQKKEQPKQKHYIPQIQTPKIQSHLKKQTTKITPSKRKEEPASLNSAFKKQKQQIPKQLPLNQTTIHEAPYQKSPSNTNYPTNNNPYFQTVPNMIGLYSPGVGIQSFSGNMMGMPPIGNYQDQNSQELMLRLAMYQQLLKNSQMKDIETLTNPNINPGLLVGNYLSMNNIRSPQQAQNMNPTAMNMNNFMNSQILAMMQNQQIKNMYAPMINAVLPAPIYNLTQVYLKKQENLFEIQRPNPNKKVKRANYHVGLAYHIYLRNLQKEKKDMRNTMQYDPTLTSKRIKKQQEQSKLATRGNRRLNSK